MSSSHGRGELASGAHPVTLCGCAESAAVVFLHIAVSAPGGASSAHSTASGRLESRPVAQRASGVCSCCRLLQQAATAAWNSCNKGRQLLLPVHSPRLTQFFTRSSGSIAQLTSECSHACARRHRFQLS